MYSNIQVYEIIRWIKSMSNERLEEMQQKFFEQKVASELGISYDELLELEYEIDTNEGHDGAVYGCIVKFSENSPKEILDKIEGLKNGYYVYLDSSIFYDEEPSDFEEA